MSDFIKKWLNCFSKLKYFPSPVACSIFLPALYIQFSSAARLCLTLYDPMDYSTPGSPVHYQHLELTQTHVHRIGDAIQPFYPLSSPSPPTFNLSQRQGLFQRELFESGGQSIGVSASASVLSMNIHDWFLLGSPCSPRDSQESSPTPQSKRINYRHSAFFIV